MDESSHKSIGEYSNTYLDQIFFIWYNNEKPPATSLITMIPEDVRMSGATRLPNIHTLKKWIMNDFVVRAEVLDAEIIEQMNEKVVAAKIEMLQRHVKTAQTMQNMAIKYLNDHEGEMTAPAAIRLLVEGIRIEKESVGLPEALEKMTKMTDDELMDEINKYITDKSQLVPLE